MSRPSCAEAVAALEAAHVPLATRRGRVVVVDARPVGANADGSAICRHRDLSVCPACRSADPAYVELLGATWYITDPAEHAEALALLAEVTAS
jgi:hypothetical protein